ncbi:NUDIX domain-containing protein [Gordonia sp. DT30]|uniref:NUDIX domain-containing protein n=1 Tax=unclassified Gordonia (in: high G+C Gram-positive bacteria) TaxID=2657482 RepID=UPI003CF3FDA2
MTGTSSHGSGTHDFEVRGSHTVYEGAILALRVDEVAMPGGRVAEREVVEHFGAVAMVARDDEGRIAMVRQYRHPLGRRLLELPAGLLDQGGESPVDAARRELAEEADLSADRWRLLVDLASSPGFTDEALRVYLAEGLHAVHAGERSDEEADMTIEWVPTADALRKVFAGDIVNATSVAGILAIVAADLGEVELRAVDVAWRDEPTALRQRKGAPST